MVKKNRAKLDTPTVVSPLASVIHTYKPSIQSLLELDIHEGDQHFDVMIVEKVVVTLFMTRGGNSILHLLYDLSCGRIKLSEYRQSLKVRSNVHQWKTCYKEWGSRRDILSRFLDFCLRNEHCAVDYTEYGRAMRKLPLRFLLPDGLHAYVLDEGYNLLLDYIINSRLMWEELLIQGIPRLLPELVEDYNRVFEFNGYYTWYGGVQSGGSAPSSTRELHTKVLYALFDKLTVAKELLPRLNATVWSHSWPPMYHKHSLNDFCNDEEDLCDFDSELEGDSWPQHKSTAKEQVYTFELNRDGTLEFPNVFLHTKKRHETLYRILGLPNRECPLLRAQFMTLCALVDPITQPPPTEQHIISIDLLYQMFLGSISSLVESSLISKGQDWRFHVCHNLQNIILATMRRLNCHDSEVLNSINNSDETVHWNVNIGKWTPRGLNTQDLELLYMVDMMGIYTIYQLYSELPVQMNPFLPLSFHLWKNLTNVLLLGLEIDRFEEDRETFSTPIIVRATIRGSAALRSVVATMINSHFSIKEHDFKHEPINLFMSPHGRKLCQGALYADVRSHAAAMLALGIELNDVTELLSDLQPGDRFDDDVKYMFDYEYDDYNAIDPEQLYDENEEDLERLEEIQQRERIKDMRGYYKRCHCVFDDDELLSDEEGTDTGEHVDSQTTEAVGLQSAPLNLVTGVNTSGPQKVAVRSRDYVEFDFNGKDWRDIPRELNFYYLEDYVFVNKLHADVVYYLMKEATSKKLEPSHASFILRSVATCVKLEQEKSMVHDAVFKSKDKSSPSASGSEGSNGLTSDFIYEKWCEDALFEKMMYYNNDLVWRMMDEMLMCSGYRRVLIWFITHLELSHSVIHYIFELVMGMRGNVTYEDLEEDDIMNRNLDILDSLSLGSSSISISIPFSRQGPIVLSAIEVNMLLQEFFINAAIYFSNHLRDPASYDHLDVEQSEEQTETEEDGTEDGIADEKLTVSSQVLGLMKLLCFMVDMLIEKKKFDFTDSEYLFELQTLLMNWIGLVPEARALFFKLKSTILQSAAPNGSTQPSSEAEQAANDEDSGEPADTPGDADPVDKSNGLNGLALADIGALEDDQPTSAVNNAADGLSESNISRFNQMLIELLPPHAANENAAVTALRSFIAKHSLTSKTAIFGRRVIYQDNAIMGLYMADREMQQREFLAEFGIDYNAVANYNSDAELSS
ncbi:AaceriAFR316Wp [[Ashbya] aceris (nom. inval.)]|nr:AaceriAFR316Wp [[Ashbya] aceris (nom. inval.)]